MHLHKTHNLNIEQLLFFVITLKPSLSKQEIEMMYLQMAKTKLQLLNSKINPKGKVKT